MIIAFHLSINYSTIAFILLLSQVPVLYKWFVFESKSTSQPASLPKHMSPLRNKQTHTLSAEHEIIIIHWLAGGMRMYFV